MPVICTKDLNKRYQPLTARALAKKRAENDSIQTLKNFSVKDSDTSRNPYFLVGTTIPNSIVRGTSNKNNPVVIQADNSNATIKNINADKELKETDSKELHTILEKKEIKEEKIIHEINQTEKQTEKTNNTSSIISGSEKMKELQQLQKQLHKSYEPKPLFEPRRPTLDSIKSAIEKAKQEFERNKNVGTEKKKSVASMSDASTSTEKMKKKTRKKKKKETEIVPIVPSVSMSNSSPTSSGIKKSKVKKKKKISVAVKLKTNIDRSSQP
ncbi:hypothetical protein NQ314_020098 [Rhamnusium bicolor]|uniref:Uncharacterized protein n=1 Tax=Rhamnusium bicolor TaxID=1586634 RepID=A0AAV8WLM4_9CUCU|nr:hypothetical protein NQ314_020098 [Rhamnusium bicolor]